MVQIIGTVFYKKGQEGDFDWQIQSGRYEHAPFLFNEDESRAKWKKAGTGNAVIRKYNKYALSKASIDWNPYRYERRRISGPHRCSSYKDR